MNLLLWTRTARFRFILGHSVLSFLAEPVRSFEGKLVGQES